MEQLGFDLGAEPLPEVAPSFASSSAFEKALSGWAGGARAARLFAHPLETPLGTMVAVCGPERLHLLEFADRKELPKEVAKLAKAEDGIRAGQTQVTRALAAQLAEYFESKRRSFDLPLALHGTDFMQSVWQALLSIPYGETRSYAEQSQILGNPDAIRAVARANGANQIAIVVPCHRIIGSDGALTGYAGGLWRKRALLELESAA